MSLFTDKSKIYIPRLMQDLSITREQACGIFGNIGGETGGFAALQEKKPVIKGSRGGYGWLQWTGPRRKKYEDWCKQTALNPSTDEANYRYIVKETSTDELHSLQQLRLTTSVAAATETFMAQNLRPGVKNLEARIRWANQAEEATRIIDQKEKETGQKTGTVVATASFAALAIAFFQEHWVAILGIATVVGGLAYLAVHAHHEEAKNDILKQQAVVSPDKLKLVKKGNK